MATERRMSAAGTTWPGMLVVYRGGGYDGCFWEPNAYWVGFDGEFHCIHASGYAGVKRGWLATDETDRRDRQYAVRRAWRESKDGQAVLEELIGCFDVRSSRDMKDMADDILGETWVLLYMKRLADLMENELGEDERRKAKLELTCCICGERSGIEDFLDAHETIDAGGGRGGGGLMIHATNYVHYDCYREHLCMDCGCFIDPTEDVPWKDYPHLRYGHEGLCLDCLRTASEYGDLDDDELEEAEAELVAEDERLAAFRALPELPGLDWKATERIVN